MVAILSDRKSQKSLVSGLGKTPVIGKSIKINCQDNIKHFSLIRMFPPNPAGLENSHIIRIREHFHVNFARTAAYKNSAIPSIQRRLDAHFITMIVSSKANVFAIYDNKL